MIELESALGDVEDLTSDEIVAKTREIAGRSANDRIRRIEREENSDQDVDDPTVRQLREQLRQETMSAAEAEAEVCSEVAVTAVMAHGHIGA